MNIVLADDHVMFRHCVRNMLETAGVTIVGEASNGPDALAMTTELVPDSVVLDINMPGKNGLEVAREIAQLGLATKVVMLTMDRDESCFQEAFRAGVKAYVLKTQASADLMQALHEVSRGRLYISPEVTGTLVQAYLRHNDDAGVRLSLRERQILQLVAEGSITREIAELLNLSVKAVESHRTQLMRKLDTTNIAGLVRHAVRMRVVSP
ncbi:MAG: response regulator transcription factor [Pseudohongiella sp.]|uniref:response regulator n=1 Tax=Pseudohongiella sp. TaxID=1979412 RepID=UPI00349FED87